MASVFTAKIRRERVRKLLPYAPILLGAILMVLPLLLDGHWRLQEPAGAASGTAGILG